MYAAWIGVVIAVYPLCRWYAAVKQRRRDWWLGYRLSVTGPTNGFIPQTLPLDGGFEISVTSSMRRA